MKTGQKNLRVSRYSTYAEAHEAYCKKMGGEPIDFSSFLKLMHQWGIHSRDCDKFTCPHCFEKGVPDDRTLLLEKQFLANEWQRKMVLSNRAAVIVIDYCRFYELAKNRIIFPGVCVEPMPLDCLGIVFLAKDPKIDQGKTVVPTNIDCFSFKRSCSELFKRGIETIWTDIQKTIQMDWDFIFVWADEELQTLQNIYSLARLQQAIMNQAKVQKADSYPIIQTNYYPSYHCDNRCDANFGRVEENSSGSIVGLDGEASAAPRSYIEPFPTEKETVELIRRPLTSSSALQQTEQRLELKKYKCVLFDPCNPQTLLLYTDSNEAMTQNPERCDFSIPRNMWQPIMDHQFEKTNPWKRLHKLYLDTIEAKEN